MDSCLIKVEEEEEPETSSQAAKVSWTETRIFHKVDDSMNEVVLRKSSRMMAKQSRINNGKREIVEDMDDDESNMDQLKRKYNNSRAIRSRERMKNEEMIISLHNDIAAMRAECKKKDAAITRWKGEAATVDLRMKEELTTMRIKAANNEKCIEELVHNMTALRNANAKLYAEKTQLLKERTSDKTSTTAPLHAKIAELREEMAELRRNNKNHQSHIRKLKCRQNALAKMAGPQPSKRPMIDGEAALKMKETAKISYEALLKIAEMTNEMTGHRIFCKRTNLFDAVRRRSIRERQEHIKDMNEDEAFLGSSRDYEEEEEKEDEDSKEQEEIKDEIEDFVEETDEMQDYHGVLTQNSQGIVEVKQELIDVKYEEIEVDTNKLL